MQIDQFGLHTDFNPVQVWTGLYSTYDAFQKSKLSYDIAILDRQTDRQTDRHTHTLYMYCIGMCSPVLVACTCTNTNTIPPPLLLLLLLLLFLQFMGHIQTVV